MLLSAAIDSITEKVSIDFEHVHGNTYQAKMAYLNQWIHVNILFKLLFWLPYKNPNFVVSELFEFANSTDRAGCERCERSTCTLDVTDLGKDMFHLSIKGRMRHRFEKLLDKTRRWSKRLPVKSDTDQIAYSDFSFVVEVTKDPVDRNTLVLTEHGEHHLRQQLQRFVEQATRDICGALGSRMRKQIEILDIDIHPLPKHAPWVISFQGKDSPDDEQPILGRKINILNRDYRILMDMRINMSLLK